MWNTACSFNVKHILFGLKCFIPTITPILNTRITHTHDFRPLSSQVNQFFKPICHGSTAVQFHQSGVRVSSRTHWIIFGHECVWCAVCVRRLIGMFAKSNHYFHQLNPVCPTLGKAHTRVVVCTKCALHPSAHITHIYCYVWSCVCAFLDMCDSVGGGGGSVTVCRRIFAINRPHRGRSLYVRFWCVGAPHDAFKEHKKTSAHKTIH